MLLCRKHEDCNDQERREKHLNENASRDRRGWTQRRRNLERGWEETAHHGCCGDGAEQLSNDDHDHSYVADAAD